MKMNLSEMLKKGSIKKVEPDAELAAKLLANAQKVLVSARDNMGIKHPEVALPLAYNAMLNAGMALMAAKGYRAESEAHHKTIVEFCTDSLGSDSSELIRAFNKYRLRRHEIVYGEVEAEDVSESEADMSIDKAGNFVKLVSEKISPPKEKNG